MSDTSDEAQSSQYNFHLKKYPAQKFKMAGTDSEFHTISERRHSDKIHFNLKSKSNKCFKISYVPSTKLKLFMHSKPCAGDCSHNLTGECSSSTHSMIKTGKPSAIDQSLVHLEPDTQENTSTDGTLSESLKTPEEEMNFWLSIQDMKTKQHDPLAFKEKIKNTVMDPLAFQEEIKINEVSKVRTKQYKCTACSYSASRKDSITTHSRTHTGEKPFKCGVCSYSASDKSTLTKHSRTHTKEKPFQCTECSYSASQKSSLTKHLRRHTGEKPFKCGQCSYTASRKDAVNAHSKIHYMQRIKTEKF